MEIKTAQDIANILSANSDIEDILYELYVKKKVEKGINDYENSKTISLEEWELKNDL